MAIGKTPKYLANQLHRIISKGDVVVDTPYDIRDLILLVKQVANEMIIGEWSSSYQLGQRTVDEHFVATYKNQTVKVDANGDNYIDIPVNYVNLPNHTGIQRIIPENTSSKFYKALIPIPPYAMDIYASLPAGALEQQFGFMPGREIIKFTKRNGRTMLDELLDTVEVSLVVIAPEDLGDNDYIPIPSNLEYTLLKECLRILGVSEEKVKDELLDDNTEQRL